MDYTIKHMRLNVFEVEIHIKSRMDKARLSEHCKQRIDLQRFDLGFDRGYIELGEFDMILTHTLGNIADTIHIEVV